MADPTAEWGARRTARASRVVEALKALGNASAKTIFYGSALLAVAAVPGAELPGALGVLAAGLGVEALGSILDRLVQGEKVPAGEIREAVEAAIAESGIAELVTKVEFQQAMGRVLREERLIRAAVEHGEYALAGQLADQYAAHQALLAEVQDELCAVQGQLETLATYDQGAAILKHLEALSARLDRALPAGAGGQAPATPPADGSGLRVLRVFLASPGDVAEERKRLRRVIEEFNQPGALAEQRGVILKLLAWEDASAGMGRPEQVILDQMPVGRWDVFVGALWTRFGTPSGGRDPETGLPYDGGTEEEFRRAYHSWLAHGRPHILFYRRRGAPASLDDLDPEQFGKVRAFFKQFETGGVHPGLYTPYETPDDFERRVRQDLTKLLPRLVAPPTPTGAAAAAPKPAPDHDGLERPYLEWLTRVHGRLELRGIRVQGQLPTVALDRVYVALKGSESSPGERADSRELLDEEARLLVWDPAAEDNHWRRRGRVLVYAPIMPSLVERDRPSVFADKRQAEVLNLAEAFRRHRWLVVLGDPGSGKTTLARWLTLHLAQAFIEGKARVQVCANQVDPAAADGAAAVDLGPARLPVLLRVSDYADARQKHKAKDPDGGELALADYLGRQPWLGEYPTYGQGHPQAGERIPPDGLNALIKARLRQGRAVIILDGLDEITRGAARDAIVRAVESFVRDCVVTPDGENPFDDPVRPWRQRWDPQRSAGLSGNQLMATSRIAGYHASPLSGHMAHFTIEPMADAAIDRFCEAWTLAVHELLIRPEESLAEAQARAGRSAAALKAAIHDPGRPGVAEMASNPLLLTILALVHHNTEARLPEQRVRLYQIAVENLTEVWRDAALSEDEVVNVLAPVAAHIHSQYATGLIPEPELRGLLAEHLAAYRYPDLEPDQLPPDFNRTVDGFLTQVRERVGMLAERGGGLYGFLHLTFQEYLAARHLVRDPDQALARILAQADDPRWREPVLLALGFAMTSQGLDARERLLQGVLDAPDPLGDLLPRRALLLAAALPEFVHMPGRIVSQVTGRLLAAYADRQGVGRFDFLRGQIERSLARLRRGEATRPVDQALLNALAQPPDAPPDLRLAAAAMAARHGWRSPALAEALLDALPSDTAAWEWPAARGLAAVAAEAPQMLPASRLPFRRALSQAPELAARIEADFLWQRLIWALCGGLSPTKGFDPGAIYREPTLAPQVLAALGAGQPAAALAPALRDAWDDAASSPEQAAEGILGLLALGEAVEPLLTAADARPGHVARVQDALGRLLAVAGETPTAAAAEQVAAALIPFNREYPDLLAQALAAAGQIASVGARARALTDLAPHLPPDRRNDAVAQALAAAGQIAAVGARATALTDLAPHLPPDLLAQALAAAGQIAAASARARALTGLAPHLPPDLRADALAQAARDAPRALPPLPPLPPLRSSDDVVRAQALIDVALHLPPDLRADALGQALAAASQIAAAGARATALTGLAPHLPPDLLAQALAAAGQIAAADARAAALTGLAPHLSPDRRTAALAQALAAAGQIAAAGARATALTGLAPHLPPDLLAQALAAAAQLPETGLFGSDSPRARALTGLAPHVAQLPDLWRPLWAKTYGDLVRAAPIDAARGILERLTPAFPWDWLADPARRAGALAEIRRRGAAAGAALTPAAGQAVDRLLADGLIDAALSVLPLLRWPDKNQEIPSLFGRRDKDLEALPLAQNWRRHAHPGVAAQVRLLLAEAGQLDAAALPGLAALLAGADDRSRYRLGNALHGRSGGDRFKTSAVGRETVAALVRLHDAHQADPRVGTPLHWTLTGLHHDAPALVEAWAAALAGGSGADAELAETILSGIHAASPEVWGAIQGRLAGGTPPVQKALLNSVYWLLQFGGAPKDAHAPLRAALHGLLAAPEAGVRRGAVRCLGQMREPAAEDYPALQGALDGATADQAALALADLAIRDTTEGRQAIVAWLGAEALAASEAPRASLLAGAWARLQVRAEKGKAAEYPVEPLLDGLADLAGEAPERLLEALWRAGADDLVWGEYHERLVRAARALLAERTSLVDWLVARLEKALADEDWEERRIGLAFTAAAAEAAPAAFARRADPDRLETLLIRAVDDVGSFNARRFALTALGHLRRVTPAVVAALRRGLRDVSRVQQDALAAVGNFRRIEGDLTPALAAGLADESAAAAYGVALGLEALGRTETTTAEQRQAILDALAAAVRDPGSQREVYVLEAGVTSSTIKHLGRLDQLLHGMLVGLAEG